jgi:hypothetical protein
VCIQELTIDFESGPGSHPGVRQIARTDIRVRLRSSARLR